MVSPALMSDARVSECAPEEACFESPNPRVRLIGKLEVPDGKHFKKRPNERSLKQLKQRV